MWTWRKQWLGYAAALCATAVATALAVFGVRYVSLADVIILYLVVVVVVAWRFGLGPSIIAGLGGVLAFDFLILPPRFTFSLEFGHAVTLVGMVFVSALVSGLTESLRREQARALRSERRSQKARLEDEVERVDGLLRNLLAITRVETGELRLQVLPASLDEVLSDTLRRLKHRLLGRNVTL